MPVLLAPDDRTIKVDTKLSDEQNQLIRDTVLDVLGTISSKQNPQGDPDESLRAILPLLKEYTSKLEHWHAHNTFPPTKNSDTRVSIVRNTILFATRSLAQFTSQRLSRAKDDLLRLELEVRLAEFEARLAIWELGLGGK